METPTYMANLSADDQFADWLRGRVDEGEHIGVTLRVDLVDFVREQNSRKSYEVGIHGFDIFNPNERHFDVPLHKKFSIPIVVHTKGCNLIAIANGMATIEHNGRSYEINMPQDVVLAAMITTMHEQGDSLRVSCISAMGVNQICGDSLRATVGHAGNTYMVNMPQVVELAELITRMLWEESV
ncbi:hypothetical protein CTI12_AA408020 [Artemisia annua]|uniref:Uncharacterized protein n=1 Tax=Artemisia annua TaxID=35608 RepID=A0A2U1M3K8_ARTAN|nr:hypothetical protein CTI12_AA408020 [Artemisia annua]